MEAGQNYGPNWEADIIDRTYVCKCANDRSIILYKEVWVIQLRS